MRGSTYAETFLARRCGGACYLLCSQFSSPRGTLCDRTSRSGKIERFDLATGDCVTQQR